LKIADVDWTIIRLLQQDGRKPFKELGDEVGYTGWGAKKRVARLLEHGVLRLTALINTEALGFCLAMILLEMESAAVMRKTIERYRDCPHIISFFTTRGGDNLIALVMVEDQGTLESESMERCALRSGKGIRRSEVYPVGTTLHTSFLPLSISARRVVDDVTPCGVECQGCPSFQVQKCVGCPSTSCYKGPLK
jgi:Lrp/AsnC family leucine-responsive transcriptional regulator